MRVSVTKKIIGMVVIPILFICIVVGVVSSQVLKENITDEIELQLKTGAYSISQTLTLRTLKEEMNTDIHNLYEYTGMDVTVFDGEAIRVASTINNAVGTKMDSKILAELKKGNDYFATDANVNGQPYFGYYVPFSSNGTFSGATFTGIPQEDANKTILFSIAKIIGCIVVCGVLSIVVALLLVKRMVLSIKRLETTVNTLIDNDLTAEHDKYKNPSDEIENISNQTVDYAEQIKEIVKKIIDVSSVLKNISYELSYATETTVEATQQIVLAVEEVANGANSQAKDTQTATDKISVMSEALGTIKDNAENLKSISDSMNNAKKVAFDSLFELKTVNATMEYDIETTSNQVNITSENVKRIKDAVGMIQNIASQTRLLSLNASVEASRVGEQGKGFSVVATEMGKLASQSREYSTEIENILRELENNYGLIIENVNVTNKNMELQSEKLVETQATFSILENDIKNAVGSIENISNMVKNLDDELGVMVDMISNLSAISEENSASTEETMASMEELNSVITQINEKATEVDNSAELLMSEVNVFKI